MADGDGPDPVGVADDPTFGALALANLKRLRGEWDGARAHTVDVLREFPNSGTAHSLMGDIHADQGMYEEAAQWYRMALDLEPDNAADARKLEHAQAILRERAVPLEGASGLEEAPERAPRLSPLLLAGWAAAAFLVVVIALGLWINGQRPRDDVALAPPTLRSTPAPEGEAETGRTDAPPVPTPSAPEAAPPVPATTSVPPATAGRATPTPAPPVQGEAALLDAVRPLGPPQAAGLVAADVLTDPRLPSATITLDGSRVDGAAADWMSRVHDAALVAAHAAMGADERLRRVTVRVEMPLRAETGVIRDVAFIGELTRTAHQNASFDRRWWHPGLAPPAAIAGTDAAP